MKKRLTLLTTKLITAILLLLLTISVVYSADIWYEDNNMGVPGGIPSDFKKKFYEPDSWSRARKYIKVYLFRADIFLNEENNLADNFIKNHLVPVLKNANIQIAINVGGATFMQRKLRRKLFEQEIALIEKLENLGAKVSYVSFQSVLSKKMYSNGEEIPYSLEQRVADAIEYATVLKKKFPHIQVGIIDALPSQGKDYKGPYSYLVKAFNYSNLKLSYIHLDLPYELVKERRNNLSWSKIKEVENFVKNELGIKFGIICTSRKSGYKSDKAFHDSVLSMLEEYALAGGNPDHYIIASWFPYPKYTIPDTASDDEYPVMRTVLEFAEKLKEIEQGIMPKKKDIKVLPKKRAIWGF